MVSWTDNPDWKPLPKTELCGYVSDAYTPCENPKPCPIHDREWVGYLEQALEALPD